MKRPAKKHWRRVVVPDPAGGPRVVAHVGRDLRINKNDLQKECSQQPGLYGWYAQLYVRAKSAVETAEAEVVERTAAAVLEYGADDKERPLKERRTHTALRQAAVLHPKVRAAQRRLREAKALRTELELLLDAFKQRNDMLKSLSFLHRRDEDNET